MNDILVEFVWGWLVVVCDIVCDLMLWFFFLIVVLFVLLG